MSRGIFSWNWQDEDRRPLGGSGERDLMRSKRQALRVLPGVTGVFALVYLGMAVLTVAKGEFEIVPLLGTAPAAAAVALEVRGVRRRNIASCAAGLGVLFAWAALSALAFG